MKAKNLSIILLQSHFLTVTNDEFQLLKIVKKNKIQIISADLLT